MTSGDFAALQLDDDPHPVAVGFVAQVGDAFDRLLADQLGDVLEQPLLVDLERDLGDDDRDLVALLRFLGRRLGADGDRAAAGRVGVEDALAADDRAAGREVRPGIALSTARSFEPRATGRSAPHRSRFVRSSISAMHPVDDLPHVVRRDVGRHADRDAGRAVDQQVRIGRRKNGRLFGGLVEVGDEVDGLLVEIAHHLFGELLETRFGVAIGGRRIAVDRAEVPLAVDQEVAHVEVLREADQRVVGRRVAVRVVVADDFADDLRALAVGAVGGQPHLPHRVEHAPVGRLQAVAYVRQRAPDDHAHRVIHVRALHLVFDVDGEFVQEISVMRVVDQRPRR